MKTDSDIQRDVIAELKWDPAVKATKIGVEVNEGVVTLDGTVTTFAEKWAAERAAQRVVGVKALAIGIEVKLSEFGGRSDADIARSAQEALRWVTYLPKDAVKVMVEKGWVTLSGVVDWDYQRQTATSAVRYLTGVTGLTDNTTIKPTETSREIKSEIEESLARRAEADDQDISVDVRGADVTLTGTVTSWWQRDLARESAWSARGVQHVADNLTIAY